MRVVKEELGDGRVGVGMIGVEQEEEEEEEEEQGEEMVVEVAVLPRMSSM